MSAEASAKSHATSTALRLDQLLTFAEDIFDDDGTVYKATPGYQVRSPPVSDIL
jgi:hypothetical protein